MSGAEGGGTFITISGAGFVDAPAVSVGGVAATGVAFVDVNTLTVVTPAGVGAADVTVVNPNGQSFTLSNAFYYGTIPISVSSVSPDNGPDVGGTSITISGSVFAPSATVTVGGEDATSVVRVDRNTITAVTASNVGATASDVVVTNPDSGSGTLTGGFNYFSNIGLVFVTSVGFAAGSGDLVTYAVGLDPAYTGSDGLEAGDFICQNLADAASLGGTWTAWLSSSSVHAKDRIFDKQYNRIDGVKVADDLADLTDNSLDAAISVDENGDAFTVIRVWTGTNTWGLGDGGYCSDWTGGGDGTIGNPGNNWDEGWTKYLSNFGCEFGGDRSLYCFQD